MDWQLQGFLSRLFFQGRTMTVTLTQEQSRQISTASNPLSYAIDPSSRRRYVLLGSDVFERMRGLIGEATLQDVFSSAWSGNNDEAGY